MLKNTFGYPFGFANDQIIPINGMLKNDRIRYSSAEVIK